jgi:hypothetical protein
MHEKEGTIKSSQGLLRTLFQNSGAATRFYFRVTMAMATFCHTPMR